MPRRAPVRAAGRPTGGSESLVRDVLAAALRELGAHGFAGLRIDDVAAAAGVNKTTIYRRWPTKAELVMAALQAAPPVEPVIAETGDLRADLIKLLTAKARLLATPAGRKIALAMMSMDDELAAHLRHRRYSIPCEVLRHAIERGDLPAATDPELVSELLYAPVLNRALVLNERVDPTFVATIVDHVLAPYVARR
jgi:AcrR family transcriptional regulator